MSTAFCFPFMNVMDSSSGIAHPSTIMPAPRKFFVMSSVDFARSSESGNVIIGIAPRPVPAIFGRLARSHRRHAEAHPRTAL